MTKGTYETRRPGGLCGEEGLMLAVIARAVRDATHGRVAGEDRADAWAYFAGPRYTEHLTLIGLPAGWLPEAIEQEASQ